MKKALWAVVLAITFAMGCGPGDEGPTPPANRVIRGFTGGDGILVFTVTPENKLTLDIVKTTGTTVVTTGTCQAPTPVFGTITCTIETSSAPAEVAVGLTVRLFEIPGVIAVIQSAEPGTSLPAGQDTFSTGAAAMLPLAESCSGTTGTYSTTSAGSSGNVGILQLNAATPTVRSADFSMNLSGSSFAASYSTTVGEGSGLLNAVSSTCSGGSGSFSHFQSGSTTPSKLQFAQSPSGLAIFGSSIAVPADRAVTLNDIAGRTYKGFVHGGGPTDLFTLTLGARTGNVVDAIASSTSSGLALSFGSLSVMAASDAGAAPRFSAAISPANALSATFPKAANIPGLLFTLDKDGSGNEKPNFILAARDHEGKIYLVFMLTKRGATTLEGGEFAFAREE